jgi:FkbM family methyltransferase
MTHRTQKIILWLAVVAIVFGLDGVIPAGEHSELVHGAQGITYLVPTYDSTISSYLRVFGEYEQPAREFVLSFIKEGDVVLDVGSNIGSWTVPISKYVGPNGKVFAFEVWLPCFTYLSANIALNGLSNVHPMMVAVGRDSIPVVTPTVHPQEHSRNSLNLGGFSLQAFSDRVSKSESILKHIQTMSVPSVRLDDLFTEHTIPCPHVIKMDIELHELHALQGASTLIQQCHPVLYIELSCRALSRSIITLLHHAGYSMAWVALAPVSANTHHFGRTWRDASATVLLDTAAASNNIIAVPTARASEFWGDNGELRDGVFPIVFESGLFMAHEYNIT